MQIRLARQADAEAIRAIYNVEVLGLDRHLRPRAPHRPRSSGPGSPGTRAPTPPSWPSTGSTASSGSARSRPSATGPPTPPRSRTRSTSTGARRGQGVGRLLLDELVALAVAHGFHTVIARISGDNEPSIALHQACGFELVGRRARGGAQVRPLDRRRRPAADALSAADRRPDLDVGPGQTPTGLRLDEVERHGLRAAGAPVAPTTPPGEQALTVEGRQRQGQDGEAHEQRHRHGAGGRRGRGPTPTAGRPAAR